MRAAAQYGGAPAWIEPIYEMGAALVYRLEFGLISSDDIEPPWDDIVIAVKAGFEMSKASARGGSGGKRPPVSPTKNASATERQEAILAAQKRMQEQQGRV